MKRVLLSWSSGKDAMLTLLRLQEMPEVEVVGLFTTYSGDEVPIQGTPLALVQKQAQLLRLPLCCIALPHWPSNDVYKQAVVQGLRNSGLMFDTLAFGDLFLDGIAEFRRSYLEPQGWETLFPLMGEPTSQLAREIIQRGIETYLISVDTTQLSGDFCGQRFDACLLEELPQNIDPCGERGEFHTLVVNAPAFSHRMDVVPLQREQQTRFHFQRYQLR